MRVSDSLDSLERESPLTLDTLLGQQLDTSFLTVFSTTNISSPMGRFVNPWPTS
jgi:hypothetical protein